MSTAVAQVYDKLDASLLARSTDPQARWIAAQLLEEHPEDELLISVSTASATVFVGASCPEEATEALIEARRELAVDKIELRGREDVVGPIRAMLGGT
jgi:hypothetical protein